jgi:hypothetical protein
MQRGINVVIVLISNGSLVENKVRIFADGEGDESGFYVLFPNSSPL